jgi:hypothetical protein
MHNSWLYCILDTGNHPKALMKIFDCCENDNIFAPKVSRVRHDKIRLIWECQPYMGLACGVQFTFGDDNIIHYMWYASESYGYNHDLVDEHIGKFDLNEDCSTLTSSEPFQVLEQYFSTKYNYR